MMAPLLAELMVLLLAKMVAISSTCLVNVVVSLWMLLFLSDLKEDARRKLRAFQVSRDREKEDTLSQSVLFPPT